MSGWSSAIETGCLYYLNCKSIRQRANATRARAGVNVWHQRFGHLNETSLKQLAKEELVDGLISQTNSMSVNHVSKESSVSQKQESFCI